MFLTRDKPQQWRFFTGGYWTAWTTTTTTLASQWGLLINIDSATGDIPQTASGWIEDERYGFYVREQATSTSAEFDTAVLMTGTKTLKLSTLDATWVLRCFPWVLTNYSTAATNLINSRYFVPCKGSTKYRFTFKAISNNLPVNWFQAYFQEMNSVWTAWATSTIQNITGTTTETTYTVVWTTAASAVYLWFFLWISVAWNIADVWIDVNWMKLEEVIEPVANSLVTPSPSLVSFTAVGSTDNIDQSQLTINSTWSFNVAAQYQAQQFTPTKSKLTWFTLQKNANTGSPTGTMTFSIVNDSADNPWTTVYATSVMSNATYLALANDTDFTVNLPCNLVAGTKYWLKVSYSISSWTDYPMLKTWTPATVYTGWLFKYGTDGVTYWTTYAWDYYFKTLYYKPTTNFKASQNNLSVSISADKDGFLQAGKINLLTGAYTFDIRDVTTTSWDWLIGLFSSTTITNIIDRTFYFDGTVYALSTGSNNYVEGIIKVKLPWGITNPTITGYLRRAGASYSTDGISYTPMLDNTGSSTAEALSYTISGNITTLYIKLFSRTWGSTQAYFGWLPDNTAFTITWTVDVSSYSVLKNYPTNKDIIKQYSTTLSGATTTATYRATKWGFPAIEYSATEYQFLDVDTTATGSTVAFSELWTTYTTVADGASLAISSTSTPNIFVKANITANRLYSSSNDYNASSSKDWSLKQTITYQVVQ